MNKITTRKKSRSRFLPAVAAAVSLAAALGVRLSAGLPPGINYQGRYLENNVPFTGSKSNCRFKIYDALSGGTLRWSSPAASLNFDKGLFNYVIECSSHDWRAYDSYLEVEIDGVTLAPRERLQGSPYAFYASSASFAYDIPALSVDTGKLAANAVTSAKILDGTIASADIGDRQISNDKLLITSTYTFIVDWYDAPNTVSDTDIAGMYGTLTVSSAPATIFIFGNITANGKAAKKFTFKGLIDGNLVSQVSYKPDASDTTDVNNCVALVGARRVTSAGSYVVKLQYTTDDAAQDIWIGERSIMAYVLSSP